MKKSFFEIAFYLTLIILLLTLYCLYNKSDNKLLKVKMMESSLAKDFSEVSYGMFATELIKKGEIIENCPIIVEKQSTLKNAGRLSDYYFDMPDKICAFPLGYGGVYNHSKNYNADTPLKNFNLKKRIMTVTANRDILPGEEVTLTYGDNYWKTRGINPR